MYSVHFKVNFQLQVKINGELKHVIEPPKGESQILINDLATYQFCKGKTLQLNDHSETYSVYIAYASF